MVGKEKLTGTLTTPDKPLPENPAILLIHRWMGTEIRNIDRAAVLAELGYTCMTFNLRGHGTSEGKLNELSINDHIEDCVSAYDFFTNRSGLELGKVGVVGASYGAYLAAVLSSKRHLNTMVLRAPAIYKDEDMSVSKLNRPREPLELYRKSKIPFKENVALRALCEFNRKVLIIESENDKRIPHQVIENYCNAVKPERLTYIIMAGADHSLSTEVQNAEFTELLVRWFE